MNEIVMPIWQAMIFASLAFMGFSVAALGIGFVIGEAVSKVKHMVRTH